MKEAWLGWIEVKSRIIFYFIHACQILKFLIWKVDTNLRREGAKWSKDNPHAYKFQNPRHDKKKSKCYQHTYIKDENYYEEKWCVTTQFSERLLPNLTKEHFLI